MKSRNRDSRIVTFAGVGAAALALTQNIQATSITGSVGFGGNVTWNTSSAATATEVTAFLDTQVLSDTGTFASFITPVIPATFTSSTWNLNDGVTMNDFWSAGGFTFNLLESSISQQGGTPGTTGFVVVNGTGTVSGNGFSATSMVWSFTAQDPKAGSNPDQWTFSASANTPGVPDGGATLMLLGLGLTGTALLRRKVMA